MNILKFVHKEDFGHEWYAQLLNVKNWSLLQVSVSWNDYSSWPYLQVTSGSNGLLGVLFWAYKFGFDVDVFSRTWSWDFAKEVDEKKYDYTELCEE